MSKYILPIIFIFTFLYAFIKKVNAYNSFAIGCQKSFSIVLDILPYITTIMIMIELMHISGVGAFLAKLFEPVFSLFGIPKEVCELILIKPFSGSGSISVLDNIYCTYGVDSYISKCASVICSSSDTVFYISTLYFSKTKIKRLLYAIPVSLISCFFGAIISCIICKIF